ncbi:amino acid adenylation domain-containing protein [Sedimentibacter sp. zth1]|uniref:non-ribosomal peptide synthetase n=1 Tax=Sedimentibacter sp. zth1 TaxID=2816908 RepID=UPI001A91CE61|nr:non-ribosomal peptide synthetase [Sedimentibacter sp. zth1]QSX05657.1 amino acid adenylation domain-containing protein [Sedimentibacter sp. zth1]
MLDNLVEYFKKACSTDKGVYFIKDIENNYEFISYKELYLESIKSLNLLYTKGINSGDTLVFLTDDNKIFMKYFWAAFMGKVLVVPLKLGDKSEDFERLENVIKKFENVHILIDENMYGKVKNYFSDNNRNDIVLDNEPLIVEQIINKEKLCYEKLQKGEMNSLFSCDEEYGYVSKAKIDGSDVAIIQFSSGSTGTPKGVILTHKNLVCGVDAIICGSDGRQDDTYMSWLPLTHNMGLIGMHFTPIMSKTNQIFMPTNLFFKNPLSWFFIINKFRVSRIAGPNFVYRILIKLLRQHKITGVDLSCIKEIYNGSEPVSMELIRQLYDELKIYNLKKEALYPVYGMAEATLAVTFPHPSTEPQGVIINRKSLSIGDKVEILSSINEENAVEYAKLGYPLKYCELVILDENEKKLEDGYVGIVYLKGEVITRGYYGDDNSVYNKDGWYCSGDVGFIIDGQLVISGRKKDIIFSCGQNFYPVDVEKVCCGNMNIESDKLVVCGFFNEVSNKDEMAIFIVSDLDDKDFLIIEEKIKNITFIKLGVAADRVVKVKEIPKSAGAKTARYKLIEKIKQQIYEEKVLEDTNKQISNANKNDTIVNSCNYNKTEETILKVLKTIVGINDINIEDNLFVMGISSIMAFNLFDKLSDLFPDKINFEDLYTYSSIKELAQFIDSKEENVAKVDEESKNNFTNDTDIAVIGIALNTPAGNSIEEYWDSIKNNEDCIKKLSKTRCNDIADVIRHKNEECDFDFIEAGFLDNIDLFDNEFFNISEEEALLMSPSVRMHLAVMWHSLEDAGYTEASVHGQNIAVYTGMVTDAQVYEYREFLKAYDKSKLPIAISGNLLPMLPARLAYYLNLKGTAMLIDTACSSSSSAIVQASNALKAGDCKAAVVSGGRIVYSPFNDSNEFIGIESMDYRTRSFDDKAEGTAYGEGVFSIVLKKYSDAIKDNDRIYGVIKGYASNQNGLTSMGITAPSVHSQAQVISQAIKNANIMCEDIQYCEVHGTGTPVGDYFEIAGIRKAFRKQSKKYGFCAVGSVKSNMGHSYGAAGLASVIKCLLSMKNGYIPQMANFIKPSKRINFVKSPIYVNTKLKKWESKDKKISIVNCFGISGTNCSIVLEGADDCNKVIKNQNRVRMFAFSAKSENALTELIKKYLNIIDDSKLSIDDLSYSLMVRRNQFKYRIIILAESQDELILKLRQILNKGKKSIFDFCDNQSIFSGIANAKKTEEITELISLYQKNKDSVYLNIICKKYCEGYEVEWQRFFDASVNYISLPLYTFEKKRLWINNNEINRVFNKKTEIDCNTFKVESNSKQEITELEKNIGECICKVIKKSHINIDDNLFMIGINSIMAMKCINYINSMYNVDISIITLFEYDTIKKISEYIKNATQNKDVMFITKADEKYYYDLSKAQLRIYLQEKIKRNSKENILRGAYILSGKIDINKLENAINQILLRNSILRTAFVEVKGIPKQVILDKCICHVETGLMEGTIDDEFDSFIETFDLANPPFIKVKILDMLDGKQIFMLYTHHIIFDGISVNQFISELNRLYLGEDVAYEKYSYVDYSESMELFYKTDKYLSQEKYWLEEYSSGIIRSNLSKTYDKCRYTVDDKAEKYYFSFDSELSNRINEIAKKNGFTSFMLLFTAINILIYKYSNDQDVCIGVPYASRKSAQIEDMLGVFINTLAIKCKIAKNMSVKELFEIVKKNCIGAFNNADYGYEELVYRLNSNRDLSDNHLFNVMFIFQNMSKCNLRFNDIECEEYNLNKSTAKDDLTFELFYIDGIYKGNIEYKSELMSENYIKDMFKHFSNILTEVTNDENILIKDVSVINNEEIKNLLLLGSGNKTDINKTIIDMWYENINHTDNPAIIFHNKSVSYNDLEIMSNIIAEYLKNKYSDKCMVIPVLMHRSEFLIATLFGILKAGGSYIPLDPEYPERRIKYIIDAVDAELVLTDKNVKYEFENVNSIYIEKIFEEKLLDESSGLKVNNSNMSDVGYTIFTSGSTGNPKGVLVRHRELANFVQAMSNIVDFNSGSKVLGVTTISFDIFVLECFATLCNGAVLVLADEKEIRDVEILADVISDNNVNIIQFTPTRMQTMLMTPKSREILKDLKTIFIGGESVGIDLLEELKKYTQARIINMYGPTETTVWSTYKDLTNDSFITIGRPIDNMDILIISEDNKLLHKGAIGEIAIGGIGVSKGYLNNKKLTDEKFICIDEYEGKLYKTGDLGKWNQNGNLVCLGRNDYQVKIRGYRVELGEIEEIINQYEEIEKCVVVDKNIDGNNELVAYVMVDDNKYSFDELMKKLTTDLPYYMLPSVINLINEFPMTPNGKIDRKELKNWEAIINQDNRSIDLLAPANEIEKKLFDIWKDILNTDYIGCDQRFFLIGGNSLLLIMMLNEIKQYYNVEITAADLFEFQTIVKISDYIKKCIEEKKCMDNITDNCLANKNLLLDIHNMPIKDYYELSESQLRIYLLEQIEEIKCKYNVTSAFIVDCGLDVERLEKAINTVILRHEILRTAFVMIDNNPMQKIFNEVHIKIEIKDLVDDIDMEIKKFIHEFNLEKPPLMRAYVGKLSNGKILFIFDMHHIITDGSTAHIFIEEVEKVYNGLDLEDVKFQYSLFSEYSNNRQKNDDYLKQEKYWLQVFEKKSERLELPLSFERNKMNGTKGKKYYFDINGDLCNKIKELATQNNSTEFMVSIMALYILINKYTGANDINIGTSTSGKSIAEAKKMLGVFINTLVLRFEFSENTSVQHMLQEIKKMCLDAFSNADYGYENLVSKVNVQREVNRNPLFDIMFIYQIFGERNIAFNGAKLTKYPIKEVVPKYDITFEMIPNKDNIECNIEYNSELFSEVYIKRFVSNYINILQMIVADNEMIVKQIQIINKEQRDELVALGKGPQYTVDETIIDKWYRHFNENIINEAIICDSKTYSYQMLEETSNIIANYLYEKYSNTNMIFQVCMRREFLLIATLLGVLKAGGSYVPIDPTYPKDRISYILNDVKASVVLTTTATLIDNEIINSVKVDEIINQHRNNSKINHSELEKSSYMIYTSGSTGKPKGVIIGHEAMCNFVQSINHIKSIDSTSCVLGVTTISFDIFALECFVTLCYGGKLILANENQIQNVEELAKLIVETGVNIVQFTPSRLSMMLELKESANALKQVNVAFVGGESLNYDILNKLRKYTDAKIINVYGPTETTVWSTYRDVTDDEQITIGKPLDNTDIFIIDKNDDLIFRGGFGELAIGGMGVSKGYVNDLQLTNERFIEKGFANGIIYKTGDLVKWSDEGNLICLGRIDNQVKIRGYRVELGEIEEVIRNFNIKVSNNIINKAAVIAKDIDGFNNIYAFVEVESDNNELNIDKLTEFIASKLPFYMLPKSIIVIDRMPITPNGKINRKALYDYKIKKQNNELFVSPTDETEKKVLNIWIEILKDKSISCQQNFFEVGGNSLLLIKMLKKIKETFPVNISAGDLFKLQSVKKIAGFIKRQNTKQDIYLNEIEFVDKFFSTQKSAGINVKNYKTNINLSKQEAYAKFVFTFLRIISLLNNKEEVAINLSNKQDYYSVINFKINSEVQVEYIKKEIFNAFDFNSIHISEYAKQIRKKNNLKLLFTLDYKVNYEKIINDFDVIVSLRQVNDLMSITSIYDGRIVNKAAIEYTFEKIRLLYNN